jgi:hypothetical protein
MCLTALEVEEAEVTLPGVPGMAGLARFGQKKSTEETTPINTAF